MTVIAGRDDVFDLCRVWAEDRSLLLCNFETARFALSVRARAMNFSNDSLKLISDDAFAEITFRFTPDLLCLYADPRHFPEDIEHFERGLVVVFPCAAGTEPDMVSFVELKDNVARSID